MPYVQANGVKLYYETHGSGRPLLLIGGLGSNHVLWAPVLPALGEGRRCIVFDNRGAGRSEVPDGLYSIEQMGDDTAALLEAIGLESADCLGYSLGGAVAQALAYRHPQRVRRLVLLSSLGWYTPVQHAWLDATLALRRAVEDPLVVTTYGMPWVWTSGVLANHDKALAYARLAAQDPCPTSLRGWELQGEAIRVYDSRPHLAEIRQPTLVLVGAEDVLTPVEQSAELAGRIPNATLHVVPRGGTAASSSTRGSSCAPSGTSCRRNPVPRRPARAIDSAPGRGVPCPVTNVWSTRPAARPRAHRLARRGRRD